MSIQITNPVRIAGVEQTIGTQLSLDPSLEADLVTRKCAIYLVIPDHGVDPVIRSALNLATGAQITSIWTGTKAEYNAIAVKDANTQYVTDAGIYVGDSLVGVGATIDPSTGEISFVKPSGVPYYGDLPFTPSNIGTRVLCGRSVNSAGVLGNTFHVMARMVAEFDAVRVILANPTSANVINVTGAVCAGGSTADPLQSSATWTPITWSSASSTTIPLSADSNNPTILLSDWIPVAGDSSKLISARIYIPSAGNTTCPVYSGGVVSGWTSKTNEEWIARYQSGDFVTTPTGMNNASNRDNSAIIGFQYMARGNVFTVLGIGDSIMQGTMGTLIQDAYWVKGVRTLRELGMPIECANFGWSGQTTSQVYARAAVTIPALLPSLCIYGAFSPNDGAPTASSDKTMRFNWLRARDLMRTNKVLCLPVNGVPRAASASSSNWTNGQDDIRKTFNTQVVNNLLGKADIATALSNSEVMGTASWYGSGLTDDFTHPNEAGNIVAGAVVSTSLKSFVPYN